MAGKTSLALLATFLTLLPLASSVRVISTSVDKVYPTITASPTATAPLNIQPFEAGDDDPDGDVSMDCFNSCYGIDRAPAMDALNWMCNEYRGSPVETSEDNLKGYFNYPPSDGVDNKCDCWEQGTILMEIQVTEGVTCESAVKIEFDHCFDALKRTVDKCNADGVNRKRGGSYTDGCITWIFNPNYWFGGNCWKADCTTEPSPWKGTMCKPRPSVINPPWHALKTADSHAARDVTATTTNHGSTSHAPPSDPSSTQTVAPVATAGALRLTTDDPDTDPDPLCHKNCHGFKHDVAVEGINWFCDYYDQATLKTSEDNIFGRFYYDPDDLSGRPCTYDEGVIVMQIFVTPGTDCNPTQLMNKDACVSWLYRTINMCPSFWDGAIVGGNITNGCLTYGIMNSYYHPTTCWTDDCINPNDWHASQKCPRPDVTWGGGLDASSARARRPNQVNEVLSNETSGATERIDSIDSGPVTTFGAGQAPRNTSRAVETTKPQPNAFSALKKNIPANLTATNDVTVCFDRCFGVDRARLGDAMSWMCNWITGHMFTTPDDNRVGQLAYSNVHSDFQPDCLCWEEGAVLLKVEIAEGTECSPSIISEFDWCYQRFKNVVDGCNTDGENGKQGGTYTDGCLTWTIDPNPWYPGDCWHATCSQHGWQFECDHRPDVTAPPRIDTPNPTSPPQINTRSIVARTDNPTAPARLPDVDIDPTCYERCFGINRIDAMAGAEWMCNYFNNHAFNTPADSVIGTWSYSPHDSAQFPCTCYEQGEIIMRIDVIEGTECIPTFTVNFDWCYDHFRTIVDNCNTGGVDGKQGGELTEGCLKWSLDPNPWYSPNCWNATCEHDSNWFSCSKRPPT